MLDRPVSHGSESQQGGWAAKFASDLYAPPVKTPGASTDNPVPSSAPNVKSPVPSDKSTLTFSDGFKQGVMDPVYLAERAIGKNPATTAAEGPSGKSAAYTVGRVLGDATDIAGVAAAGVALAAAAAGPGEVAAAIAPAGIAASAGPADVAVLGSANGVAAGIADNAGGFLARAVDTVGNALQKFASRGDFEADPPLVRIAKQALLRSSTEGGRPIAAHEFFNQYDAASKITDMRGFTDFLSRLKRN